MHSTIAVTKLDLPTERFLLAWLIVGILAVLSMVFVTPPFQTPDEAQHFFRAYQVSEGTALAEVHDGMSGGRLPASLQTFATHFLGPSLLHAVYRPVRPTPLALTLGPPDQPLDVSRREFINFSGLAFYSPLPYAGSAVGMAVARLAGLGTRSIFYMGRAANGLLALAILYFALRLFPFGRELIAFVALMPMPIFLYGSCSPDALILSTAFLFIALVLNRMAGDTWSIPDYVVAILSATTFCTIKPVYTPILMFGFLGILYTTKRALVLKQQVVVLVVCMIATVVWLRLSSQAMVSVRSDINVPAQMAYIVNTPFHYLQIVVGTIWAHHFYYMQFVGRFGWLTITLPLIAYMLPGVALIATWGSEQRAHAYRPKIFVWFSFAIIAMSTLLLFTALYLTWTPVGAAAIEGIQGRYFLPLAPLAALSFLVVSGRKKYWENTTTQAIILGLIVLEAGLSVTTQISKYSLI
jgi:uncharacterized membrane protein